ncbi:MAG: hypothetical protein J6B72_01395 [Clostridia bacterium]|nr:hypothetical protein [Clostridia bacterium]
MSEKSKYKENKWQKFIFVVLGGGLGIILLIFGGGFGSSDGKETESAGVADVSVSADAYADMLESRVSALCAQVKGAGRVTVFVSLRGGYRTVYAMDSQSSTSGYKSEIVMSGSGSDKRAVVTAYENPEIAGVGIVCEGGGSASVRQEIISLVSAALDVSTNKIFVAQSQS